ncbi:MAG: DUF6152 family protein [Gammaproteobacteria bacterium]|nr:DUF6152 family protein [Gammaproteobacteria bacterium]MCZ6584903.1 DUF6152 family protein [Gammaproteobacteria bacterium]
MRLRSTAVSAIAIVVVIGSAPTLAHHGLAAYTNETRTVQATITNFRFVNPHVQLYFDVENETGEVEHWQAELTAPNKLSRGGWTKSTLKPGDEVQITGRVARNGGRSIRIRELRKAGGEPLPLREVL